MDAIIDDITRVVNLLDVLKSRFFFLRAKYDIEVNSPTQSSADIQTEYQYVSNDLQSFIMIELHLLEYACTYGIYSLNMYATRLKTSLTENDNDNYFLKLLKGNVRSLIETNNKIKNNAVDSYSNLHFYINSFTVYANVLNSINIPETVQNDETQLKKKKDKLMKKIMKINLMSNIITFLVSTADLNDSQNSVNMALKFRTHRSLEYYANKLKTRNE